MKTRSFIIVAVLIALEIAVGIAVIKNSVASAVSNDTLILGKIMTVDNQQCMVGWCRDDLLENEEGKAPYICCAPRYIDSSQK